MCAQVNLLEAMENMDQETFEFRFGEDLVYTTLLSDGQMVELIAGGSNVAVRYEDRSEFIRLVQKARLEESKQQVGLQCCYTLPSYRLLLQVRLEFLLLYVLLFFIINSSSHYAVYRADISCAWLSVCVFQIAAMQAGLLKVVPQAVLDLLTWQEVEKKVCGDPEISVEALKRLSECPA